MAARPFVWGQGGRKLAPEDVERQHLVAQALLKSGADFSPATGGLAEALGRGFNGWASGRLGQIARDGEEAGMAGADEFVQSNPVLAAIMGSGQAAPPLSPVAEAIVGTQGGGSFPASLVQSESGGNWNALNSEGYGGRLQFGDARLADAAAAGIIPAGMTGAEFSRLPPEQQQAVEQWHFADIDSQAANRGLNSFIGQSIGGIPITQDAIRAMAHLGGIGGAGKFLQSGGAYNPGDSNGTRLSDYASRHGGGASGGAAGGPSGDLLAAVMQGMSDPWVRKKYGPVLEALMGQQMGMQNAAYQQQLAQQEPMYELKRQMAELELEQMRNPGPAKPVFEGGQWWDTNGGMPQPLTDRPSDPTSLMQNLEAAGYVPGTPEYAQAMTDAVLRPGVSVAVDSRTNPVPATGYRNNYDEDGNLLSQEAIPGGPADQQAAALEAERQQAIQKEGARAEQMLATIDSVINDPSLDGATGWRHWLQGVPGSGAKRFSTKAAQLQGQVFLEGYQMLKGAGAITDYEGSKAEAAMARLDTSQSPQDYREALKELREVVEAGANRMRSQLPSADAGGSDLLRKYGLE